jgi:signal peptidase I
MAVRVATPEQAAETRSTPPPARTRARRWLRISGAVTVAAVIVTPSWWYLAPPQLGGSTSLATVDGTSMLPRLQRSDLVALRPAGSYHIGEIVGYHSALLHRTVLHRIVAIHDGHYSFKGDNNSFVDPDQPTRAQLIGRLWFVLPSAGHLIAALRIPWVLAIIAALLIAALGLGRSRNPASGETE